MKRRHFVAAAAMSLMASAAFVSTGSAAEDTVLLPCVCELSGPGAVSGVNFRDGAVLAAEEINAAGGILGKKIAIKDYDTQSDAQTSRSLVQKAIDDEAYVILGTIYSGSTIVNMLVAQENGVPQLTGSEGPTVTEQGNPYIFRTSSSAAKGVPALTAYFKDTLGVKKIAVAWVNNEFGKGGRDVFVKEMKTAGIDIVADIPSEQGQADFAADVAKIKDAGAQASFVYLNEEESARFLREAKKQGLAVPLVGEVTLTGQKVIDLAGDAANGAYAHVGITAGAETPSIREFSQKFQKKFNRDTDHNGLKGYVAAYTVKYVTEQVGSFDQDAFAKKMHGLTLDVKDNPGMLLTTTWDDKGEMSRESFMTQVVDGKQKVIGTVPAN